jgi:Tol biopolymer transport system component
VIKNGERPGPARRLLTRATLGVLALYALGIGCDSDSNPLIPTPEELGPGPDALVVSEPVPLPRETELSAFIGEGGADLIAHLPMVSVLDWALDEALFSFVSFQPGTYPEGDLVDIRNVATGQRLSAPMVNGGLDPVGIPAEVGDTIEIRVFQGTTLLAAFSRDTPKKLPPKVVRTDPPDRKTKVPLNTGADVIFSEPIRFSSLTSETFRLELNGDPVPGSISLIQGGFGARLRPFADLRFNSEYTIFVGPGVADLSGDTLGTTFTSTFQTVEFPESLPGKIAFEGWGSGWAEIYIMNPDGTGVVQVTDSVSGAWSMAPALSPDGNKVAFTVPVLELGMGGAVVSDWDIYTSNTDGTGIFNVTNHPGVDRWRPAWSPSGTELAFCSTREEPGNDDIYLINADGTNPRRLTSNTADDGSPAWSPDGSRIAFVSNRDGNPEIYVIGVDGLGLTRLTDFPGTDEWPAWSRDGSQIAFASNREGGMDVFVMNADGSNVSRLTEASLPGTLPSWSPDGAWIAYDCVGICVMRADGSGPMRVSSGMYPSWSQQESEP